jgi:hypothetical protein
MTQLPSSSELDTELNRIESLPVEEQIKALASVVEMLEAQLR